MLQAAALGMAIYGLYSIVVGAADVLDLEWWANLWLVVAGAMLLLAAIFVRASMPGSLALAIGGLLGLQSISLHNDPHAYGQLLVIPQVARAVFAGALVLLARLGWEFDAPAHQAERTEAKPDSVGRRRMGD